MRNRMKILVAFMAFGIFSVLGISAQHSRDDYAYQNSTTYNNYPDTRYPNSTGYDNYREDNYRNSRAYNSSQDARFQNRGYFRTCAELQRLYQIEDALYRRIDADLAWGDRREARRDKEKLEDVQEHIYKAERRYALANPNYRNGYNDRRNDRGRHGEEHDRRSNSRRW
jgi:hypothetical protein